MLATDRPIFSTEVSVANEQATRRLAGDVAAILAAGDTVALSGDLGAGKTTFTRAVIRHLADDETLEVPSPTFTLLQQYQLPRHSLVHVDLYRVTDPAELEELGFDETGEPSVLMIEWPERLAGSQPLDRLDIALTLDSGAGQNSRIARLTGHGTFAARLQRMVSIRRLLDETRFADAKRRFVQGDASTRTYERLYSGTETAVLMDAPRRPDGPPVRDGKPYSAIAHLAEDVTPYIAVARWLRRQGLSAPEIYTADLKDGLVLVEDLGTDGVVAGDPPAPIEERYAAAVDLLAALHHVPFPTVLPVVPTLDYRLPPYDLDALLIEAELLLDWYVPHEGGTVFDRTRREFAGLWRKALETVIAGPITLVLRDFHSPNLLWLKDREGPARLGLLDFQDALIGPDTYDLVSLLQDARVDVPEILELALLSRYAKARSAYDPRFDLPRFAENYAVLGAQRATKILGIFARLDRRDNKPQYLRHLPRVWGYLRRSLSHPALESLRTWYDRHAPAPRHALRIAEE